VDRFQRQHGHVYLISPTTALPLPVAIIEKKSMIFVDNKHADELLALPDESKPYS